MWIKYIPTLKDTNAFLVLPDKLMALKAAKVSSIVSPALSITEADSDSLCQGHWNRKRQPILHKVRDKVEDYNDDNYI